MKNILWGGLGKFCRELEKKILASHSEWKTVSVLML